MEEIAPGPGENEITQEAAKKASQVLSAMVCSVQRRALCPPLAGTAPLQGLGFGLGRTAVAAVRAAAVLTATGATLASTGCATACTARSGAATWAVVVARTARTAFAIATTAFSGATLTTTVRATGTRSTSARSAVEAALCVGVFLGFFSQSGARRRRPAIHHDAFDRIAGHALDLLEQTHFAAIYQRQGHAFATGTASTANAVNVVFRNVRQFEVDHVRQLINVQTTCGDVSSNQHHNLAVLEASQRTGTSRLALVAVQGF